MAIQTYQCQLAPQGVLLQQPAIDAAIDAAVAMAASVVLIFADVRHFQPDERAPDGLSAVEQLTQSLRSRLPHAAVIGCSTAGEIIGSEVHVGSLTMTAIALEGTLAHVCSVPVARMEDSAVAGRAVSVALRELAGPDLRQVWVFAPGVSINGSALVAGLKSGFDSAALPGISGGLAGDGGAFVRTFTIGPQGVKDNHVVALGFSGRRLRSGSSANGGWEAFGPARRVTRAQGNVLLEMDHESALEIYRRYLGEYAKDLPSSGLLFPLQITQGPDSGLIRTILGIDEEKGSLILAGDVSTDSHVRLMHASTHHLVEAAEKAAQNIRPMLQAGEPALAVLVSCVGRRIVMGDLTEEEVEVVGDALPAGTCITGFYSNGEIAAWNFAGDCRLHNQTMTISWLAEQSISTT
jgi:hypothetical protein